MMAMIMTSIIKNDAVDDVEENKVDDNDDITMMSMIMVDIIFHSLQQFVSGGKE